MQYATIFFRVLLFVFIIITGGGLYGDWCSIHPFSPVGECQKRYMLILVKYISIMGYDIVYVHVH